MKKLMANKLFIYAVIGIALYAVFRVMKKNTEYVPLKVDNTTTLQSEQIQTNQLNSMAAIFRPSIVQPVSVQI